MVEKLFLVFAFTPLNDEFVSSIKIRCVSSTDFFRNHHHYNIAGNINLWGALQAVTKLKHIKNESTKYRKRAKKIRLCTDIGSRFVAVISAQLKG